MTRSHRQRQLRRIKERFERAMRKKHSKARPGPFPYVLVLDGLKPDFNIGKIFRSADALGAAEIHLVGIDFFDPAPAKGSAHWLPSFFHPDFASCHAVLTAKGYSLFALAPGEEGMLLSESNLPAQSAFILGHEEYGLSFDLVDYPSIQPLTIEQFGKVQSLNVSIAAALVMYEYLRQHRRKPGNG